MLSINCLISVIIFHLSFFTDSANVMHPDEKRIPLYDNYFETAADEINSPGKTLSDHLVATVITPNLCNGFCNATATAIVTGGSGNFSYSWSTIPVTYTQTATDLCAGTYLLVVTDLVSGQQVPAFAVVIDPPPLTIYFSTISPACHGDSTGSSSAIVTGGTGPFTYNWTPGNPIGNGTNSVSGLMAGAWTCTVTDANLCTIASTFTITEPSAMTAGSTSGPILCNGGSAAVLVTAAGGTGAYTGTGSNVVTAGTYNYVVTDSNGCSASTNITISQPAAITTSRVMTVCEGQSVIVGASTYTASGNFTDVLTAANGCDSTVTTNLTVRPAISTVQNPTICAGGSVTVGTSTYTASGNFTDVLTAAGGCDSSVITNLTVGPVIVTAQDLTVCEGNNVTVGTNTYSIQGNYIDVLAASTGCDSTVTTNLIVVTIDVSIITSGNIITSNSLTGTYQWLDCNNNLVLIGGEISQSYTPLSNGDFAVQITDNGCADTSACININSNSIESYATETSWNIYPNPVNGTFTILNNTDLKNVIINIIDVQGREVYKSEDINLKAGNQTKINLDGVAKGIYYVKLTGVAGVNIKKIIID